MSKFFLSIIVISFLYPFIAKSEIDQSKNRVEDLFIWKISEELNLSVKEEKKVTELIKDLNKKKSDSLVEIQTLLSQMSKTADTQKGEVILKQYKKALASYNDVAIEEINKLEKILPKEKVVKYFVIKTDLSQRIRMLMGSNIEKSTEYHGSDFKKSEPAKLPDPKIIEEQ